MLGKAVFMCYGMNIRCVRESSDLFSGGMFVPNRKSNVEYTKLIFRWSGQVISSMPFVSVPVYMRVWASKMGAALGRSEDMPPQENFMLWGHFYGHSESKLLPIPNKHVAKMLDEGSSHVKTQSASPDKFFCKKHHACARGKK